PPYYDNVGFGDLSDFFYVWLRHNLRAVYPELFRAMLAPKGEELIAAPYRHQKDKGAAKAFFEKGMRQFFENARRYSHPDYPMTVFYAYRQQASVEIDDEALEDEAEAPLARPNGDARASSGWETMLSGLI
ncbi:MAG: hypothetical protein CUN49_17330, partial [Candidatus Thermofonsia Clade 1 bacterium]